VGEATGFSSPGYLGGMSINPIVTQIVGRLHVSTSYLGAIRAIVARLTGGRSQFVRLPRGSRRTLLTQVVFAHWENRDLALWVSCHGAEVKPGCIETRSAALAPV